MYLERSPSFDTPAIIAVAASAAAGASLGRTSLLSSLSGGTLLAGSMLSLASVPATDTTRTALLSAAAGVVGAIVARATGQRRLRPTAMVGAVAALGAVVGAWASFLADLTQRDGTSVLAGNARPALVAALVAAGAALATLAGRGRSGAAAAMLAAGAGVVATASAAPRYSLGLNADEIHDQALAAISQFGVIGAAALVAAGSIGKPSGR